MKAENYQSTKYKFDLDDEKTNTYVFDIIWQQEQKKKRKINFELHAPKDHPIHYLREKLEENKPSKPIEY